MSKLVDDDGYPTEEMLDKIRNWYYNFNELMQFIEPHWQYGDIGYWWGEELELFEGKVMQYKISTAGWSGNEDIIRALQENHIFWSLCWVQSKRGGHYIFEVKE
jgi:hypothetical protein